MKKLCMSLVLISVMFLLLGCNVTPSRYGSDEDIDEILIELGINNIVFINGWGDTEVNSLENIDGFIFPEFSAGEKSVFVLGYDSELNSKMVFIPQKEKYDILVYDFPLPDISIIEEKVAEYNNDLAEQQTCDNSIDLASANAYFLYSYDFFKRQYAELNGISNNSFMLFIGDTCIDDKDLSVFVVKYSENEYGLIATRLYYDDLYDLKRFS